MDSTPVWPPKTAQQGIQTPKTAISEQSAIGNRQSAIDQPTLRQTLTQAQANVPKCAKCRKPVQIYSVPGTTKMRGTGTKNEVAFQRYAPLAEACTCEEGPHVMRECWWCEQGFPVPQATVNKLEAEGPVDYCCPTCQAIRDKSAASVEPPRYFINFLSYCPFCKIDVLPKNGVCPNCNTEVL